MASLDTQEEAYLSRLLALAESKSELKFELSYVIDECMRHLRHITAQNHPYAPLVIFNGAESLTGPLRAHELEAMSTSSPGRNYCVVQNIDLPLIAAMGVAWNIDPDFFLKFMTNCPSGYLSRLSNFDALLYNDRVAENGAPCRRSSSSLGCENGQAIAGKANVERGKSTSDEDKGVHEHGSAASEAEKSSRQGIEASQHGSDDVSKDLKNFGAVIRGHFKSNRRMSSPNWVKRDCSVGDLKAGYGIHHLQTSLAYYATPDFELFLLDDSPGLKNPGRREPTQDDAELWLETLDCADHSALKSPISSFCEWQWRREISGVWTSYSHSYTFDTLLQSVLRTAASEPQRFIRRKLFIDNLWPRFVVDVVLSLCLSGAWRQAYQNLKREIEHLSFVEIRLPDLSTHERLHSARRNLARLKDCVLGLRDLERFTDDEHRRKAVEDTFLAFGEDVSTTSIIGFEWYGITQSGWSYMRHDIEALEAILYQSFQILLSSVAVRESQLNTEEARRSMQQSRRGLLLTWLAFIYAPLSFITGIFGMNVKEINGSTPPFWTALVGVPLVLIITLALFGSYKLWEQWRQGGIRRRDNSADLVRSERYDRELHGKDTSKLV